MSNILQNLKWQFRIDPVGSLFFASFFVLFFVFVVALFFIPFTPPELDDCTDIRQEHVLLNLNIDKNK